MTQSPNEDPRRIHIAEQMWATMSQRLDQIIEYVRSEEPQIYEVGGNTDASVLFDWMKYYIVTNERAFGEQAEVMTLLMCAAAITRLVRAPLTDDVLAQLDKEIEGNDDH
jgi:hypothetical protein